MPNALLAESTKAFKAEFARQLRCEPEVFETAGLTIVQRPEDSRERHVAIIAECGLGTVISVRDDRLIPWVRENAEALPFHFRVFQPAFLESFADEARRLGHDGARTHSSTLGMVLGEEATPPALADGLSMVELSEEDIRAHRETDVFDNALLETAEPPEMLARFRAAFAVKDGTGRILGVSGVWDQYPGIDEIGVDVTREARGQGLARALTIHATRWIREQGRWPIYTMGYSNLRSMNNGLACGYRPAWMLTAVFVPK